MDFELSDEQRAFRDEVVRFARRELSDDLIARDAESTFDAKAWQRCAEFGHAPEFRTQSFRASSRSNSLALITILRSAGEHFDQVVVQAIV